MRALFIAASVVMLPVGAAAQVYLTVPEALELAFPTATSIERRTAFLTEAQLDQARRLAGRGVKLESALVTYYEGLRDTTLLGSAYFETHLVRTLPETVMIVVNPAGSVVRIEILRFGEPPEYLPPDPWLKQLIGRGLSAELSLKGDIRGITGATMTARAIVRAVRRVLALHGVLHASPGRSR